MHCTLPRRPSRSARTGHHLERVAEDHAVRPVLVVLVELGLVHTGGYAVEVGEQIRLRASVLIALLARLPE